MALHALRKRVGCLFSRRRQQSPPSSPSGQPCAFAGASELSDKVQGTLHHAAARGDLKYGRWDFKNVGIAPPDQQRRTPLHLASANGHGDVIRNLAGKNCQLNLADNIKRTPPSKAIQRHQEECVTVLLEHGANPNLADADGNTALHLAVLPGNSAVAGLLREQNASGDAQNQGGYTPLNLAVSKQHEEMLECLLKKAADGQAAEQCERTACAVTTSHEADVEEDNLHLHEELEMIEEELREMEEKYLHSERCVQNLVAALDEKDREELAAAQELQDQLSAYFENQTTVKRLEEYVQRLEIKITSLEATVEQQSKRIEDLQRDLQASARSASLSLREMEEKYLHSERCVQNLVAALDEKERETTASALKLQDQLSAYLETVKKLEEHAQRLGFEKTRLEDTVQQQSNKIAALQRDLQASTSAQPVSQYFIDQSGASHHHSLTNQLKDRIRDREWELDRIKDTQQESTSQKQGTRAEVEKYKELYLKEVKISKWQAKERQRANERLEEANAKLLRERHKSKSLITSSIVSGGLAATPALYSPALGHLGNNLGVDRSLSPVGSILSQCEKILLSRKRLATSAAKIQQKLDEKITKELKEATAELETGCSIFKNPLRGPGSPLQNKRGVPLYFNQKLHI